MYAKYVYKAGATAANVLADVLKLIADGDISALSADAVQASCTKAGVATGWTLDDAAYGIISAPYEDGVGRKTFQLSQAANVLKMAGMDAWNVATHTGTNVMTAQAMTALPLATGGTVWVNASPEVVAIWTPDGYFLVGAEVQRIEPFFKGRSALIVIRYGANTDFKGQCTRAKAYDGNGDWTNFAVNFVSYTAFNGSFRGENEEIVYQILPINPYMYSANYTTIVGPSPRGVVSVPYLGALGDSFTDGVNEYSTLFCMSSQSKAIGVLKK